MLRRRGDTVDRVIDMSASDWPASNPPVLDVEFVRSRFPAFADPDTARWAHLENAGGSYAAAPVIDALTRLFTLAKVQPGWDFGPSRIATEAMERARRELTATFGFGVDEDEIHFGPSTSQNTDVLARAMRPMWDDGDEIVVTEQDHEANSGVWRRLAATGIVVKEWRVDPGTGLLDPVALDELLGPRTRLVTVTHASNLAATINPIRLIADRIHGLGGHLVVDGVSYAPHGGVDVGALDCDVYLYSAYKTYGPHVGMMYTRRELLERLTHQGHYFNEANLQTRLTPAGPDHAEIGACAGITDYFDDLHAHHFPDAPAGAADSAGHGGARTGPDDRPGRAERIAAVSGLMKAHEQELMAPLLAQLARFVDADVARLVGSPAADSAVRAPTISFWSARRSSREIADALVAARVSCGYGHFYSHRLVRALGLDPDDGVVRLSMVHYTTAEEVARAMTVLDELLG